MNVLDKAVPDHADPDLEEAPVRAPKVLAIRGDPMHVPSADTATRPAVDPAAYRSAMACFASGVTVTTTVLDGTDHAMTATAVSSVSLRPPLVLVCIERIARFHDAVLASGTWAVSVLAADGARDATWFATRGRPLDAQLEGVDVRRGLTGAPLLAGAIGWLECRTWAVYDGGDHSIVVGEVVAADVAQQGDEPLVYFAGDYRTVSNMRAAPRAR